MVEESPAESVAREMSWLHRRVSTIRSHMIRFRRKYIPHLVWYGAEVDVGVVFSTDKLAPDDPMRSLFSGEMAEIEDRLRGVGIQFDRGVGLGGRDWEWDWSLRGPISVRFRRSAQKPERRREAPRPTLVVNNGEPS